jgi:hypothetical protein
MTATPFTDSPMNLIKLLNNLRTPDTAIPESITEFASQFLDADGKFNPIGKQMFLDKIAGYISYLNREKDARSFAYPVFHSVFVPMSQNTTKSITTSNNDIMNALAALEGDKLETKQQHKLLKRKLIAERKEKLAYCKSLQNPIDRPRCKDAVENELAYKKTLFTAELDKKMANIQASIEAHKVAKKRLNMQRKEAIGKNMSQEYALDTCLKR